MKPIAQALKPLLLAGAITLAAAGTSAQDPAPKRGNWGASVTATEGGHLLGNPEAPAKLVEYMSYTCSHCAEFARIGEGAIKLAYLPTGKINFEIRHLIRDPVDLTAAILTNCGEPGKFPGNHTAILTKQDEWFAKARSATQAQQARWQFGTNKARFQAIASDLDFYEIMERRGYSRAELDRCLADEAMANSLAETSRADTARLDLKGTPTFVLDGAVLESAHSWDALRPILDDAI